jgi:hypothetical protein
MKRKPDPKFAAVLASFGIPADYNYTFDPKYGTRPHKKPYAKREPINEFASDARIDAYARRSQSLADHVIVSAKADKSRS